MSASDQSAPREHGRAAAAGRRVRRRAAEWLALRSARGFTAAEHAAFAEWCAADPRHAEAFAEVESSWRALDRLAAYPHSIDESADPDLLAPPRRRWRPVRLAGLAAALAVAAVWSFRSPSRTAEPAFLPTVVLADTEPKLLRLPDGSLAELNADTDLVEDFTVSERRVRLRRGEAHFTVAKDQAWPFIVEAGGAAIRAVGTEFNVRLGPGTVEVLVTEGRVTVSPPAHRGGEPPLLKAGERTVVPTTTAAAAPPPVIETIDLSEVDRALAWQRGRLVFDDLPLTEVAARFNRYSAALPGGPRLTMGDGEVGALRVSGRVRADNLRSFVEVLETNFGITAESRAHGEIVLRRRAEAR